MGLKASSVPSFRAHTKRTHRTAQGKIKPTNKSKQKRPRPIAKKHIKTHRFNSCAVAVQQHSGFSSDCFIQVMEPKGRRQAESCAMAGARECSGCGGGGTGCGFFFARSGSCARAAERRCTPQDEDNFFLASVASRDVELHKIPSLPAIVLPVQATVLWSQLERPGLPSAFLVRVFTFALCGLKPQALATQPRHNPFNLLSVLRCQYPVGTDRALERSSKLRSLVRPDSDSCQRYLY